MSFWSDVIAWLRGRVPTPTFPSPPAPLPSVALDDSTVAQRARCLYLIDMARLGLPSAYGKVYPAPHGLSVLQADSVINDTAQAYSQEEARLGRFSHQGPDGSWAADRMRLRGYSSSASGEDIAWGQTSADQVVDDWCNSPGHWAQIINPVFTSFGCGCAAGADGRLYWVLDFSRHA